MKVVEKKKDFTLSLFIFANELEGNVGFERILEGRRDLIIYNNNKLSTTFLNSDTFTCAYRLLFVLIIRNL